MTNKEAIELLKKMPIVHAGYKEVIDIAIEALNCSEMPNSWHLSKINTNTTMTTQTVYGIARKHGIDVLPLVLSIVTDGTMLCSMYSETEKDTDLIEGINSMKDPIERQAAIQPEQQHGRVFKGVVVEYPSYNIYPEYIGKPYFSIKYTENGQKFIGYGTYSPEVLSEYLKEYFMPSAQPDLDEWCTDCKEYDLERHCCPRWNRVIRKTVDELRAEQAERREG